MQRFLERLWSKYKQNKSYRLAFGYILMQQQWLCLIYKSVCWLCVCLLCVCSLYESLYFEKPNYLKSLIEVFTKYLHTVLYKFRWRNFSYCDEGPVGLWLIGDMSIAAFKLYSIRTRYPYRRVYITIARMKKGERCLKFRHAIFRCTTAPLHICDPFITFLMEVSSMLLCNGGKTEPQLIGCILIQALIKSWNICQSL